MLPTSSDIPRTMADTEHRRPGFPTMATTGFFPLAAEAAQSAAGTYPPGGLAPVGQGRGRTYALIQRPGPARHRR